MQLSIINKMLLINDNKHTQTYNKRLFCMSKLFKMLTIFLFCLIAQDVATKVSLARDCKVFPGKYYLSICSI